MKPDPVPLKPWRKSVGFWLGAVVAVFLGWAAVRYTTHITSLTYRDPAFVKVWALNEGSFQYYRHEGIFTPFGGGPWMFRDSPYRNPASSKLSYAGEWAWGESVGGRKHTVYSVPLWFLSLACLGIWFGTWTLGRRRIRKRMARALESIDETDREL